jgi:hypothetical protein
MFWKMIGAIALAYCAALYFSITLGGFVHALPLVAIVFAIVRRMGRTPDSEFGRWKAPVPRPPRR